MASIELDSLRKEFTVPEGVEVAVNDIHLHIKDGEFLTLLGPSGCGKTTTLRCIAGLETPTSGEVRFDDDTVTDVPANKRNLAMMFQNIALYPHMKIKENIAYPLKIRHVPAEKRYQEAEEAAEIMQISDLLEKYPGDVSGGQRQRAALARTIVQDPVAFLMDEPLSDLDAKLKTEIQEEIQLVHKRLEKPTIYVTHDQQEALRMSDRIAVLDDGEISQVASPRAIFRNPANRFIANFIGSPSMNFIEGEVISFEPSEVVFDVGDTDFTFEIADRQEGITDGSLGTIGVRPQELSLAAESDGHFTGSIELLEPIDERTLASVQTDHGRIQVIVSDDGSIEEGDRTGINFMGTNIYLFDRETDEEGLVAKLNRRDAPRQAQ